MEKFIGENLVSKIGIIILVIAIGFFVKYAIDQNWIGAVGRVGIGALCGGLLIALAHRLRNSYHAFSSVLTGGGLAVLYFTITLAFQQFHLFSQVATFIIMVIITAFAVGLSLLYDKQEVAVLALIGGFATPFMASNGGGNYQALFVYLLILNTGLLVLSYFKKWRLLNFLAFIFTVVLFASWLFTLSTSTVTNTYIHGLWFATVFYLLFFSINVAHNIRQNKHVIASDFGIILANTALYFSAALYCLAMAGLDEYRGLLCTVLAVFNLGVSLFFFKTKKVDPNILYLLIGITLTFISLAAPVQLKGNQITLFWACEAVLLYWLSQKSNLKIIQLSSLVVWICMLLSLFMDWNNIYFTEAGPGANKMTVLLNKGFIVSLFASASSGLIFLLRKKKDLGKKTFVRDIIPSSKLFGLAAIVLLYLSGVLEINYQFDDREVKSLYEIFYTTSFIMIFLAVLGRRNTSEYARIKPGLLVTVVVIYLLHTGFIFEIQARLLAKTITGRYFSVHWLTAILIAFALYQLIRHIISKLKELESSFPGLVWVLCAVIVYFLSVEIHLIVNAFFVTSRNNRDLVNTQFIKIGLPILWGICSFVFMWVGMHYKHRNLRIISLALFGITLIKLFFFDIRNISEAGKIAAFFCLGVLLLVVSFMYQRLKKIIISEEAPSSK